MTEKIWAPWRIQYILGNGPEIDLREHNGCVLCHHAASDLDDDNLVVYRGGECYVMMNLYPYNGGHVMVVPNRHVGIFEELTESESGEMMSLAKRMMPVFKRTMRPDGFNLGINLGKTAGAGIAEHIHLHIVPRWDGDCNFMPVLADTKVINEHIEETFVRLRDAAREML